MSADLRPGRTIRDGIAAMEGIAAEVLDDTFSTALTGQSRDFSESSRSLIFVFLLALGLVYLTLAAQFESFRDPIAIMLSVPLALAGALFTLWYFRHTLNVFSQIGMIMLIGLVTKKRHPDRRVRQPAKGAGAVGAGRRDRRGRHALPPGADDDAFDGASAFSRSRWRSALDRRAVFRWASPSSAVLLLGTVLTLYVVPAVYSYLTREITAEERQLHAGAALADGTVGPG